MTKGDEKPTILIVDDVPGNIKTLAEIIKEQYRIIAATSGERALEAVETQQIDLILLDVVMPEMDGYEVCRQLKANQMTAEIPVVFVTGQNEETDETHGLEMGAVDYITKPATPSILKARIKNHLEAKHQRDTLKSLSLVDSLTGVANRRHFDQFLSQEWNRAVRGSLSLAIVMIDIDYFKRFNDYFGHSGGDACLKKVAETLQNTLKRSTDLFARYGGEEFVVVLPQVEHHGGAITSERLRKSIEDLQIPHPKSGISDHVTISLGCASMMPTRGSSPQPMLDEADRMLYAAKESGRNQVKTTML
ncbi:MAG: diguanylate cyclase [Magnetococcales bacterium]|nr:diguanylate cyclase [Magnetococcales bacterium]